MAAQANINLNLNLTASQANTLEEFENRMSEELDEFKAFDRTFSSYRFLRARNWDSSKAEFMLRKSVQWRKENNISNLFEKYEPSEVMRKYFNNFFIGHDKEGCPIFYGPVGKFDVKGMFKSTSPEDIDITLSQMFDKYEKHLEYHSIKKEKWLTGFVYIMNCSGLTIANATHIKGLDIVRAIARFQQNNAPERLKAVYFINTPTFFMIPYNFLKGCINSVTMRKMHLFGSEGYQEALLKIIDADVLPMFMGGTRTDPDGDPMCKTAICQYGVVDESYHLDKNKTPLSDLPGVKDLQVVRASTSKINIKIKDPGSVIEWEFVVKHGDIGFGLCFNPNENEDEAIDVVPMGRFGPNNLVESGNYKCEKTGHYFVLFDNTYSWFRSKDLVYRIQVFGPNEHGDQKIKRQDSL